MISEREVLRELADRCRAAGAEVAARVLVVGDSFRFTPGREALENDVAVSRLPPDDAVLVLELVEELVREGMNEDVVEALALWRDGCVACALHRLGGAPGARCDEHGERSEAASADPAEGAR